MDSSRGIAVKVGIFLVVGVICLIAFSLRTKGTTRMADAYNLHTYFDTVKGLEKGADVSFAGVPIGKVAGMDFDRKRNRVRVDLFISRDYEIHEDSIATVDLKSLLGQYFIQITPGTPETRSLANGEEIKSKDTLGLAEVMNAMGSIGDNSQNLFQSLDENQKRVFNQLSSVIEENRDNIHKTTEALAEAAPKIQSFMENADKISSSLNAGEGTLGKLLKDDEMYDRVLSAASNVDEITSQIKSGRGTVGRLVYEDNLHASAEQTLEKVGSASDELKAVVADNRAKLTEILDSLSRAIPDFEEAAKSIREVADKVNAGEGTLGKLVNDPSLYNDTKQAVGQIQKTFEENEEQSVLRTFLGVVFGGFI